VLRARVVLVVAAAVGLAVAGTGCAEQSAAIRVGDQTVSEKQMLDEIDAWAANKTLIPEGQVTGELGDDSFVQPFVGSIVQQRVVFILYGQVFDDEGLELTAADRAAGRDTLDQEFGPDGTSAFPADYVHELTETAAKFTKLQQELSPDDLQAKLVDAATNADVQVSSRFGSWDNDAFVAGFSTQGQQAPSALVPPPAPQSADGQGAADLGSPSG
jgi:hypothetical protein